MNQKIKDLRKRYKALKELGISQDNNFARDYSIYKKYLGGKVIMTDLAREYGCTDTVIHRVIKRFRGW